jgi:hypothetical protein
MLYFSGYEVIFLIKINADWKTIMVNEAFYKSTEGSFARSIGYKEGKSVSTIKTLFKLGQNTAPSMMEVVQYNQAATR